ncbi:hypothetical protein L3Q82_020765 [Scortum barcoo]|uniref:Uncharacterized protein n=1 Tax=Scortum barcoo TaxID=214431 RepID=A0ACB8V9N1_9TELE|nr:hypothetical protein L3Q82_020765 [Scortum barcoo]
MASTLDFRTHADQSCRYSEEFVNIYYDCMDKKRRVRCVIHYQSALSSFTEQATQGQTTLLVVTGGTVKFEGNKQRFFNQNFLLTAQASPNNDQPVWKIASDCFRFQDWNS